MKFIYVIASGKSIEARKAVSNHFYNKCGPQEDVTIVVFPPIATMKDTDVARAKLLLRCADAIYAYLPLPQVMAEYRYARRTGKVLVNIVGENLPN